MSPHIFLDHISTTAHVPLLHNEPASSFSSSTTKPTTNNNTELWRKTLIQPIAIPDLNHIHVRTMIASYPDQGTRRKKGAFNSTTEPVLRPDGSVTGELRKQIWKQMQELPRVLVVDEKDIQRRDCESDDRVKQQVESHRVVVDDQDSCFSHRGRRRRRRSISSNDDDSSISTNNTERCALVAC